jgi:hypothetical protein
MRVLGVRGPIWLRLVAAVVVGVAVAASGCSTKGSGEPSSSTSTASTPAENEGAITARIRLPVAAFSIATGEGWVWALTRRPAAAVWRIDPRSNRLVGKPTPLPVDPWSVAVGAGSVRSNQVSGKPLVLGSPQSLAFGHGALWVGDHAGWLVKIDPTTFRIVARQRLDFGPHGVVITDDAVDVADAHGSRLLEADPTTAKVRRVAALPIGPIYPAVGAGSIWSSSAAVWKDGTAQATMDDRVVRIDPKTLAVTQTFHLGGNVSAVAFGFGSLWATVQTGQVVRITPHASS